MSEEIIDVEATEATEVPSGVETEVAPEVAPEVEAEVKADVQEVTA